jgi:hypothetical protein
MRSRILIFLVLVLLVLPLTALAQDDDGGEEATPGVEAVEDEVEVIEDAEEVEEEAGEPLEGMPLFFLLVGTAAVAAVGFVMISRDNTPGDDDES